MAATTENYSFDGLRTVVETPISFDEVLTRLRAQMGEVSAAEVVGLAKGSISEADYVRLATERYVGESGFILFAEIDHGGWLPVFGIHRRIVRWILGNPLIAVTMIRHDITAGLFAPVELLAIENENGRGTSIVYVRPSSLMVISDNPPLRQAAVALDEKFDALVAHATRP